MGFRKKCIRKGHKFEVEAISAIPYIWCSRSQCDAISVATWVPKSLKASLHNLLPVAKRVPTEDL